MTTLSNLKTIPSKTILFFLDKNCSQKDYSKIGFILACSIGWLVQSIYLLAINLQLAPTLCLLTFIAKMILLSAYKNKLLSPRKIFHLITVAITIQIHLSYINAGTFHTHNFIWFCVIPIYATTLLGMKTGLIYTVTSGLIAIFMQDFLLENSLNYNEFSKAQTYEIGLANLLSGPLSFYLMFGFYFYTRASLQRKLEKERLDKSKLLTLLFHDLGRSASLLSGYIELGEEKKLSSKSLKQIYKVSNQIKQLLHEAKELDSNEISTEQNEDVCIRKLFLDLVNKFQYLADKKDISFLVQYPKNTYIKANKKQLEVHILGNIISNAIKFSNPSSEIILRYNVNNKKIQVVDNGIGINKDFQRRLGTNQEEGSGAGLRIVNEFCKRNNYHLDFSQNIPKGTIVSIYSKAHDSAIKLI